MRRRRRRAAVTKRVDVIRAPVLDATGTVPEAIARLTEAVLLDPTGVDPVAIKDLTERVLLEATGTVPEVIAPLLAEVLPATKGVAPDAIAPLGEVPLDLLPPLSAAARADLVAALADIAVGAVEGRATASPIGQQQTRPRRSTRGPRRNPPAQQGHTEAR